MSIQLAKLNIFISGSSETDAEKSALRAVAEELNSLLEKTCNVTLGVLGWPDNIRPGINDDPQKEINRQLAGQYDIYIGLLGTRFGTPTPRAGSGTEEEFNIAVDQFVQDTTSIRVLFYFKKEAIDPFSIDVSQLEKVKEFRNRLPQYGVLYRDFEDTGNFVEIIRENLLSLIVDEWRVSSWSPVNLTTTNLLVDRENRKDDTGDRPALVGDESQASEVSEEDKDDMGFLDVLQEFHTAISSLTTTLENLAKLTIDIGVKFESHTKAVTQQTEGQTRVAHMGGSREMQKYISEAKSIIDDSANDLNNYAKEMNPELIHFKNDINTILKTFETTYEFATQELDIPESKKREDIDGLKTLLNTMEGVQGQITVFQQSVERLPALTGKFKKARRNTTGVLGELVAAIRLATMRGRELINKIDE
jgi:prefoldin subunit 5